MTKISFPASLEVLVVLLARVVPLPYFGRHGLNGLIEISFKICALTRAYAYPFLMVIKAALGLIRVVLDVIRSIVNAVVYTIYLFRRPGHITSDSIQLEHGVWFVRFSLLRGVMNLEFLPTYRLKADLMVFVHLYSCQEGSIGGERYSFDHWPNTRTHEWRPWTMIRDSFEVVSIPSGYYRVRVGLYNPNDFSRLTVVGNDAGEVSIGTLYIEVAKDGVNA